MDSRELTENIKSINAGIDSGNRVITRKRTVPEKRTYSDTVRYRESAPSRNVNTYKTTSKPSERKNVRPAAKQSQTGIQRNSNNPTRTYSDSTKKAQRRATSKNAPRPNYKKSRRRRKYAGGNSRGLDLFGRKLIPALIAVVVILLAVTGVISYAVWYNSFSNIRLSDYASVTLYGYDGYGTAELLFGCEHGYEDFFENITASIDKTTGLTNGDVLTISYSFDEEKAKEAKVRVNDEAANITVAGLPEPAVVTAEDIFSGLEVSFEGTAPCVSVKIENTATSEPLCNITYSIKDDRGYYDSGEAITIHAQVSDDDLANHAYSFDFSEAETNIIYTVPSGDRYFTDASQVTKDILEELEQVGFRLISESNAKEYGLRIFQGEARLKPLFVGNSTTFTWSNPYVISAYFHNVTDEGKASRESHANDVQLVYGVTLNQADGTSVLTEMVIQFVDLKTLADGSIDTNTSSGRIVSVSHKDSNIKNLVNDEGNGMYITTKIIGD